MNTTVGGPHTVTSERYDAVVIGAGFAGLYAVKRLRDTLGLCVHAFEKGDGVGGTWYWNRYPGARCDAESIFYSYGFDDGLLQDWTWTERFATQPEILSYAEHVADRFDLGKDISLSTSVVSAVYEEEHATWRLTTDTGRIIKTDYLVSAVGCLSASQVPAFEGAASFRGNTYHTGRWPHEGVDFTGQRVAVIGTGSSAIQAIPEIARQAEHLTVFQRTPSYSIPARNRDFSAEETAAVKAQYRQLWQQAVNTPGGALFRFPPGNALDFDEKTRQVELDRRWNEGGPAFMYSFADNMINEDANRITADYVRSKIRQTVQDPITAELLCPAGFPVGAKRICVDTDYYTTYNRENVQLVSVKQNPIERITPTGVRVGGIDHDVDAIVFATGYDAMTGPLLRMDIRGRGGRTLGQAWSEGPKTYLGVSVAGFPNMFIITGPGSPSVLTNMIASIEQHVEWIADYIAYLRAEHVPATEPTDEAQEDWVAQVNVVAAGTLFPRAASWYVGANIPGKPQVFMPYVGGLDNYRKHCASIAGDGYPGFTSHSASRPPTAERLDARRLTAAIS